MKKQSVREQIVKFANTQTDGFLAREVLNAIKAPAKQVTSALWLLKKNGVLAHDKANHRYKLTGVNKAPALAADTVPISILNKAHSAYADLVGELQSEREKVSKAKEQYEDALAIIRYLEDKLFRAIRHDARRGSNS